MPDQSPQTSRSSAASRGAGLAEHSPRAGGYLPSARFRGRSRPLPPKLYRIGEVVDYSGMSRQTIHNYTTMGLLQESRWTDGGHRLYDESVFDHLDMIAEMKAQHRSMEYIRDFFAKLPREEHDELSTQDAARISESE